MNHTEHLMIHGRWIAVSVSKHGGNNARDDDAGRSFVEPLLGGSFSLHWKFLHQLCLSQPD
jgi:hypothetical protein